MNGHDAIVETPLRRRSTVLMMPVVINGSSRPIHLVSLHMDHGYRQIPAQITTAKPT
jgi:hypothetical protein